MFDPTNVRTRLSRCPAHAATPLHRLSINGQVLWIKNESERMGLGSFKALGGHMLFLGWLRKMGRMPRSSQPAQEITGYQ
jgi:threonine dehydratase